MAADGELAREGGGEPPEGEEDDVDDEATFFSLELQLAGHRSSSLDRYEEEGGNKAIVDGRREVAAVAGVEASRRGDAAAVAALGTVRPAARLRALVRKLRKPKAAAGAKHPTAASAVTAEERRTPAEAALIKYLSKVPILSCRGGVANEPGDDTSPPPPHRSPATATVLPVPGRKSRGQTGRLGVAGSSVAASPPPTPPRHDDSLLQAQDGVAGAIAYCKLSLQLASSRGF